MSKAQAQGYAKLAEYRLDLQTIREYCSVDAKKLFIEIGFGNGEVLAQFAQHNPTWHCVGIDVYRPGIGALVNRCQSADLNNIRIIEEEATSVLTAMPDTSINVLFALFPDPWPKQRHHRRRLIDTEFVALVRRKISREGLVYIATDATEYSEQIQDVMSKAFSRVEIDQVLTIPQTRYRQKALATGHVIWDLAYTPNCSKSFRESI